ncbi:hypothetical protein Caci_0517 [Catenulispora acidiphila DSM 44928]|uniref:Uncharacterized protein n=1 Tax=Catenulispora acidiphila (strain DSM 44928 / JCM 14897 / NBRC 102108 / NRRL B-24433 / ID139908) TaxID=479433 RepID=C7PXB2_CATAD|nr:hypothetical protein Caci_0517 [Catenulispora acidiphila DSM 44928]
MGPVHKLIPTSEPPHRTLMTCADEASGRRSASLPADGIVVILGSDYRSRPPSHSVGSEPSGLTVGGSVGTSPQNGIPSVC